MKLNVTQHEEQESPGSKESFCALVEILNETFSLFFPLH